MKSLQSHMDALKKVKFAVRGEKQFGDLVTTLNEYNSNLRNMCSQEAALVSTSCLPPTSFSPPPGHRKRNDESSALTK
jgi:hypothetical protein